VWAKRSVKKSLSREDSSTDWSDNAATTRRNRVALDIRSSSDVPTNVGSEPSSPAVRIELKCPLCGDIFGAGEETCPRDGTMLFALTQRARLAHFEDEDSFDDFDVIATKVAVGKPGSGKNVPSADTLPPDDGLVGRTLDNRYRIVRRLGKGSMAVVYVAEQLSIKRKVAVKVLSPTMNMDLKELNRRFEAEAQIIARLTHPNTVRLFDYGRTPDGRPYFITELLSGRPLEEVLKKGPLNSIEVLEIIRQVARSLEEAHALGIVHRDLKPANIFIDRVGGHLAVKILDFGVAKVANGALGAMRAHATLSGTLLGTPAYMSPEQCLGEKVGPRSDLYSLGVIAYHALAGEPPFTGNTATLLGQHVSATPRLLAQRVPGLDPRIESLVHSLLSKNPDDRPGTAGSLASRIDDLERSGTVFAVPVMAPPPRPPSRRRGKLSLVAISGGIALALLAASFMSPEPRAVPAGYVDAPVSDEVHHAFFTAVGNAKYGDAIARLSQANAAQPHYDVSYNIIAAYDAWGGHCPEVMAEVERFMKLCMGCPRAETAAPRLGRIYERCSVSVMIGSVPSGAHLWIDGVDRGTTPSVMNLPAGRHVAEIKHRGRARKTTFETTPGRPAQFILELE
jgi:serine/threonine protein kinase